MKYSFDFYVDQYSKVINEGACLSGETHEFMVELRVKLFKQEIASQLLDETQSTLLDFGCGTGYTIEVLSRFFPSVGLYGFDTSKESILHAKAQNHERAFFEYGDTYKLPYADNAFDVIYSNGTFHHIIGPERLLWMNELTRVLKQTGVMIIFENNPLNPLMMQAMRKTPFDHDAEPIHARHLASIMRNAGLTTTRAQYYFFFPHLLKWLRCTEHMLRRIPFGAQYYVKAQH